MHPIFERRPKPASHAAADLPATPAERAFAALIVAAMILTSLVVVLLG